MVYSQIFPEINNKIIQEKYFYQFCIMFSLDYMNRV